MNTQQKHSELATNQVHFGDCLTMMQDIPDKSVDMILCDLPYGTTKCKWDVVIPFEPLWKQYNRIIKDNGAIVLTATEPFASLLRTSNLKNYKYDWIWNKVHAVGFQVAKYRPMQQHEMVLIFGKGRTKYNPIMIERPNVRKSKLYGNSDVSPLKYVKYRDRSYTHWYPKSIIVESNANHHNKLHPTQKPVALFEYLIKTYTDERDLVLDNCAGSCTTAIACINTKRNWICIENNQEYYNAGLQRINEHNN